MWTVVQIGIDGNDTFASTVTNLNRRELPMSVDLYEQTNEFVVARI